MTVLILIVLGILLSPFNGFAQDDTGKRIYNQWCAQCHGYEGDGEGYAKEFTFPKPRDFSLGTFKFRTTPSGDPPTDEDIIRSIRNGNPGTSMPAWKRFSDEEVKALVEYIKEFAPDVFEFEPEPIKIENAPPATEEIIKKGKELFRVAKCVECHGQHGRGNGKKAWRDDFKDDWGYRIDPANYTYPWELRNGSSLKDIYRTITTGLSGTPMTSYQDSLSDEERWALAHFIKSLQVERRLGISLRLKKVESIPESTDDPQWESLDWLDLPMAGQIIFEPRHFTPTITNVRVRGLYTEDKVAIMLEWVDKKPNKGDDGMPPDGIRLQFPSKIPDGSERPYFYMGDRRHPVNLWVWNAADNLGKEYIAKGPDTVYSQQKQDVKAVGVYDDGLYRVIFVRSINTGDSEDIVFETGRFIPFAVTVYDGRLQEQGNKGVISAWYYIMLEPSTPLRVFVLPPAVSLMVFFAGFLLHKRLSRKADA